MRTMARAGRYHVRDAAAVRRGSATAATRPRCRAVGADGKIQVDLPCRRCGYNLRSLARDARCPECSFPVIRCLRRDDLGYGDPRYVRRVALGAYLTFGASIAAVATMFLFGEFGVWRAVSPRTRSPPSPPGSSPRPTPAASAKPSTGQPPRCAAARAAGAARRAAVDRLLDDRELRRHGHRDPADRLRVDGRIHRPVGARALPPVPRDPRGQHRGACAS